MQLEDARPFSSDIQLQCFFIGWTGIREEEEETTVVELFGDFSGEPTEMAESVSSALN